MADDLLAELRRAHPQSADGDHAESQHRRDHLVVLLRTDGGRTSPFTVVRSAARNLSRARTDRVDNRGTDRPRHVREGRDGGRDVRDLDHQPVPAAGLRRGAVRAALEETVQESYRWFKGLVGERRNLKDEALAKVADGRVFTGRKALELKLIDALGSEPEAVAWLEAEKARTLRGGVA